MTLDSTFVLLRRFVRRETDLKPSGARTIIEIFLPGAQPQTCALGKKNWT